MNATSAGTLVTEQNSLLHKLADVLAEHPNGSSFRLMFVPEGLEIAEDEILVQTINAEQGVVELRPRKLDELSLDEVVHGSQVLDPSDGDFNRYANSPKAGSCLTRYDIKKVKKHIYD